MHYNHKEHAGNAGDLWKHLLLAEAAVYLLSTSDRLIYAESHAGYPEYHLDPEGEWRGGIGKCWHSRSLFNHPYLMVLEEMNGDKLLRYPGSAQIVLRLAAVYNKKIIAELWDISADVGNAWSLYPVANFHLGDGFSGIRELLKRSDPGLLLVDPPYPEDHKNAIDLLQEASDHGWVAMSWHIMDEKDFPEDLDLYPLAYRYHSLEGGRWPGCTVAVAGADSNLKRRLGDVASAFKSFLKNAHDRRSP